VKTSVAHVAAALTAATRREWSPVPALAYEPLLQFSDGRGTLAQVQLASDGLLLLRQNERNGFVRAEFIPWDEVDAPAPTPLH